MATPVVAAGAGALGFYLWLRQWQQCGYAGVRDLPLPLETHARTEAPPNTWSETIYLFKEAIRYMYQETFGRWHAIDLFFGLAYLSRRLPDEYPAADIAAAGQLLTMPDMSPAAGQQLLQQLQHVRRYMLYCQGLRHHKPEQQLKHWRDMLSLGEQQIICHNPTAGLLRPAYVIVQDLNMQQIILCVRGTHSRPDMFTSLTGTVKPHHALTADGVVLGYSHLGMLAAARWLMARTKETLIAALQENPGYELRVVGHSMGGGTAAMLSMMLREKVPELSGATAYAIACPACMTKQLAASCAPFVTTLVHGTDIVPTFSPGAIDALRHEVTGSSWFAEFQSDVRQRLAVNFNSSLRGLRQGAVGTAVWTQQNIIRTAAAPFNACYSRAERSCYSRVRRQSSGTPPAAANSPAGAAAADESNNSTRNPFSSLVARLPGRQVAAEAAAAAAGDKRHDGGAAATGQNVVDAHDYVNDASGVQASASEHTSLLMRRPALHWLYDWGSSKRHAAAAAGEGEVHNSNSINSNGMPRSASAAEAELVEKALEACLSAADSGQFGPVPGSSASGARAGSGAPPGPNSDSGSSSSSSRLLRSSWGPGSGSSGRQLPGSAVLKAASRAVLGKRPAAPGKKDDDSAENFSGGYNDAAAGRPLQSAGAAAAAAAVAGSHSGGLPVSTAAGDAASDDADPALVAASSSGKPKPVSLRRRGWGWDSMLGSAGAGWVTNKQHHGGSSDEAGRSVVRYLGDTVGNTGRLVMETVGNTSHLLKSSVMFQACAAPAVPCPGLHGGQQQQQQQQDRCNGTAAVQQQNGVSEPAGATLTTAPGSSNDMMLMDRHEGPFAAAVAANDSDVDGSSDSDPDLLDEHDHGDSNFALNQPAMRASISALMAAVGTGEGEEVSRAHREETDAAEQLLREAGIDGSNANLHRMGEQQLHDIPESPVAAAAATAERGGSSSADETTASQQEWHPDSSHDKAAERLARRRMYPAGRILHFLPASVVAAAQTATQGGSRNGAAEHAGGRNDIVTSNDNHSVQRQLPPLTSTSGTGGLGDNYALLQVSDIGVYGRMRLCPSMVTDHFIPHYIKAVDNVIGQLMLMDSDG